TAPGKRSDSTDGAKGLALAGGDAAGEDDSLPPRSRPRMVILPEGPEVSSARMHTASRDDFDAAARVCRKHPRPTLGKRTPAKPQADGTTTAPPPPSRSRDGRRHNRWFDIAVIAAACLLVAAVGWRFYRGDILDLVATA